MNKSSLGETASYHKYAEKILSLKIEFETRFSESVPNQMQMEVIEIQCNSDLKAKFSEIGMPEFHRFENTRKFAYEIISMFGSTYWGEQLCTIKKGNKSPVRSRITDIHLGCPLISEQSAWQDVPAACGGKSRGSDPRGWVPVLATASQLVP
ncbi:hypothetical protein QTO34_018717 [Cnephaeus nilssonii]|uniref:Uncharacterized protein n=1 Tax=Cnephaeus nilssonii TaxID=3371016 RepID=A0AA40LQ77_CNENI|nr:hypothetical protein QTO34_018717 [Eptesicus nilssonii]